MIFIDFMFYLLVAILSIPLWVIIIELAISLLIRTKESSRYSDDVPVPKYKILMPAHNEAEIIDKTISLLLEEGVSAKDIIVIADNCTDTTAEIAKLKQATVLERYNETERGKGFALDYGINYLKNDDSFEVLIILDADCEIDETSISRLVNACHQSKKPQQALYLMRNKETAAIKQRVAGFAWLVKNKVRPMAVQYLNLPVTLTGTGMAFPRSLMSELNVASGNIVEDMQLGIDCALDGFAPELCLNSLVLSDFPEQDAAEKTQRTRWEHGHLMVIAQQVPKLLKEAVSQRSWKLFALGLDIAVPPLSLLILLSLLSLILVGFYSLFSAGNSLFVVFFLELLLFFITLVMTWAVYGKEYLSLKELCSIPKYILSKIVIYIGFIFKRQSSWVKTKRDND